MIFKFLPIILGGMLLTLGVQRHPMPPLPCPDALTSADSTLFVQKLAIARSQATLTDKSLAVMRSFLGTPYVSGTLDGHDSEHLVINLRELDCWTSVENALAIALTAEEPNGDYSTYKNYLRTLRYWGGTVDGYGSRIHYFSGWVLQAEKLGFVRDLTQDLGGRKLDKKVSYMTDYPHRYPHLRDEKERKKVEAAQERINIHPWYMIPKSKVATIESKIQDGDLVVLMSSVRNLDVEHQGFAVRQKDGHIHLLHASSTGKKVIISARPLTEYLQRIPAMAGIMVVRVGEGGER
jgi:hypothetical protein